MVGQEADLWVFAAVVAGRADLPQEVDRADLPWLVLGLLRQRGEGQQAPQGRGLGQLDPLGQPSRLCFAGGVFFLD
jgi:hypothetical protein